MPSSLHVRALDRKSQRKIWPWWLCRARMQTLMQYTNLVRRLKSTAQASTSSVHQMDRGLRPRQQRSSAARSRPSTGMWQRVHSITSSSATAGSARVGCSAMPISIAFIDTAQTRKDIAVSVFRESALAVLALRLPNQRSSRFRQYQGHDPAGSRSHRTCRARRLRRTWPP